MTLHGVTLTLYNLSIGYAYRWCQIDSRSVSQCTGEIVAALPVFNNLDLARSLQYLFTSAGMTDLIGRKVGTTIAKLNGKGERVNRK